MARDEFYILCPDNEVTREVDERRILWSANDIVASRPALSRWHPDYKDRRFPAPVARRFQTDGSGDAGKAVTWAPCRARDSAREGATGDDEFPESRCRCSDVALAALSARRAPPMRRRSCPRLPSTRQRARRRRRPPPSRAAASGASRACSSMSTASPTPCRAMPAAKAPTPSYEQVSRRYGSRRIGARHLRSARRSAMAACCRSISRWRTIRRSSTTRAPTGARSIGPSSS